MGVCILHVYIISRHSLVKKIGLSKFLFVDNPKRCQINCSIHSSRPSHSSLSDSEYEIKKITVRFTSTAYEFPLKSSCSDGDIENVYIDLDCEGEYLHGNYTLHTMCFLKLRWNNLEKVTQINRSFLIMKDIVINKLYKCEISEIFAA